MNQNLKKIAGFFVQMDEPTPGATTKTATAIPADVLAELQRHYEGVFSGANLPGVDFMEFYTAVIKQQPNAMAYQMALGMVQGMNPEATPTTLEDDAGVYLQKIEEAATSYIQQQGEEKNRLLQQAQAEKASLTAAATDANNEIAKLEEALRLQREKLAAAQKGLGEIDARFAPGLTQIEGNLAANDQAKQTMVDRITTVVANLKKFVTAAGSAPSTHYYCF